MAKMAYAGDNHRHAEAVGGLDDFRIVHRSSGLDDGGGSDAGDFLDAIGEGKEGVRGCDRAFQWQDGFHGSDFAGVHAAHLSSADADGLPIAGVENGV